MKKLIKALLRESLIEKTLDEDYPSSWNIEEFKKLSSFNQRIQYCKQHLQQISSGSSRIVYKIDDQKVLKLAKNKKGLAQNEIEASYSTYEDLSSITARVFSYDNNNDLWIEMELAKIVTPQIFKQVTGFDFNNFCQGLSSHYYKLEGHRRRIRDVSEPSNMNDLWADPFVYEMLSLMANYDIPVGDLCKINSYGLVNREGEDTIVMIDYGLTNEVYDSYYS